MAKCSNATSSCCSPLAEEFLNVYVSWRREQWYLPDGETLDTIVKEALEDVGFEKVRVAVVRPA